MTADELAIAYDPKLGLPTTFRSDAEFDTSDDEPDVTISDFVVISDSGS